MELAPAAREPRAVRDGKSGAAIAGPVRPAPRGPRPLGEEGKAIRAFQLEGSGAGGARPGWPFGMKRRDHPGAEDEPLDLSVQLEVDPLGTAPKQPACRGPPSSIRWPPGAERSGFTRLAGRAARHRMRKWWERIDAGRSPGTAEGRPGHLMDVRGRRTGRGRESGRSARRSRGFAILGRADSRVASSVLAILRGRRATGEARLRSGPTRAPLRCVLAPIACCRCGADGLSSAYSRGSRADPLAGFNGPRRLVGDRPPARCTGDAFSTSSVIDPPPERGRWEGLARGRPPDTFIWPGGPARALVSPRRLLGRDWKAARPADRRDLARAPPRTAGGEGRRPAAPCEPLLEGQFGGIPRTAEGGRRAASGCSLSLGLCGMATRSRRRGPARGFIPRRGPIWGAIGGHYMACIARHQEAHPIPCEAEHRP